MAARGSSTTVWSFSTAGSRLGDIVNQRGGLLSLCGDPININGAFRNGGEVNIGWGMLHIGGEFNNRGTVYTDNRNGTGFQGNWIGEGIKYR